MPVGDEGRCLFYCCDGGMCATPLRLDWLLGEEGGGQREQSRGRVTQWVWLSSDMPGVKPDLKSAFPLWPSPALCFINNLKASEKGKLSVLPGQPCVLFYTKVLELISALNLPLWSAAESSPTAVQLGHWWAWPLCWPMKLWWSKSIFHSLQHKCDACYFRGLCFHQVKPLQPCMIHGASLAFALFYSVLFLRVKMGFAVLKGMAFLQREPWSGELHLHWEGAKRWDPAPCLKLIW